MVTPSKLVEAKIDRAEFHVTALEKEIRQWVRDNIDGMPAQIDVKDGNSGEMRLNFSLDAAAFIRQAPIIGDSLHNLRSSLDHIAWELVKANGGIPNERTCFPIYNSPQTPNRRGISKPRTIAGGVDSQALAIVDSLQPFNVNPANPDSTDIWHLHRLNIVDKHHSLLISPEHVEGVKIRNFGLGTVQGTLQSSHWVDDIAVFDFAPDEPNSDVQGQLRFQAKIEHGLPGAGMPIIPKLRRLVQLVRTDYLAAFAPYFDPWATA